MEIPFKATILARFKNCPVDIDEASMRFFGMLTLVFSLFLIVMHVAFVGWNLGRAWIYIFLYVISIPLVIKYTFFKRMAPYIFLAISYSMLVLWDAVVDKLKLYNFRTVYDVDKFLFSWLFGGKAPTIWAVLNQNIFLVAFLTFIYSLHIVVPVLYALYLLYKNDLETYRKLTLSFVIVSFLGMFTFLIFPVAPPWFVYINGIDGFSIDAGYRIAAMKQIDNLLGIPLYETLYSNLESFRFGAVPSLHVAFPIVLAWVVMDKHGKKSWPIVLFPIMMYLGSFYLIHHYLVDGLLSILYSWGAIYLAKKTINLFNHKFSIKHGQALSIK